MTEIPSPLELRDGTNSCSFIRPCHKPSVSDLCSSVRLSCSVLFCQLNLLKSEVHCQSAAYEVLVLTFLTYKEIQVKHYRRSRSSGSMWKWPIRIIIIRHLQSVLNAWISRHFSCYESYYFPFYFRFNMASELTMKLEFNIHNCCKAQGLQFDHFLVISVFK